MNYRFDSRLSILKGNLKANRIGSKVLPALAFASALGMTTPAVAADPIVLPAGVGCKFELRVDIVGSQPVSRLFYDKNGKMVRFLNAGRGTTNTYTNLDTGASLTIKPSGGSVSRGTANDDGTTTFVGTGFNGIISFPTDTPAGPSTILYIGRVVYTIDASGNWTLIASSGKQVDICAALSPTP